MEGTTGETIVSDTIRQIRERDRGPAPGVYSPGQGERNGDVYELLSHVAGGRLTVDEVEPVLQMRETGEVLTAELIETPPHVEIADFAKFALGTLIVEYDPELEPEEAAARIAKKAFVIGRAMLAESRRVYPSSFSLDDLEQGFNIICNVHNWSHQSAEWQEAARKFRDRYIEILHAVYPDGVPGDADPGDAPEKWPAGTL